jgi:hypothetical protein
VTIIPFKAAENLVEALFESTLIFRENQELILYIKPIKNIIKAPYRLIE